MMNKQLMKKNSSRLLGLLLLIAFLIMGFAGCSDMITTLTVTTNAGADMTALTNDTISFSSDDTFDAVSEDFTLPVAGDNGSTIVWESSDTDVLTVDNETGAVTVFRPEDRDADVKVTATFTDDEGNTFTKTFLITVLAEGGSGDDSGGDDDGSGDNDNAIGNTGPAGGIVFYDKGSVSDGWRYLEAAPVDINGGALYLWGDYGTLVDGTGTAIGTGAANTAAIVDAYGNTGNYPARLCDLYEYGGYDDWFLPSKDELDLMYDNKDVIGELGDFSYYWSSSEYSSNQAWSHDFGNGVQYYSPKGNEYRVRAVRAF